jgi:prefoldin subunit 5
MTDLFTSTNAFSDEYKNPRGIPRMPFVENIDEFVRQRGVGADAILRGFSEQHSKYKLMEHKLNQNLATANSKIPEITKTLDALDFLQRKQDEAQALTTQYALTDLVFCEADVPPQATVHLWLGANVMVEYPISEARALLQRNLASATTNLQTTEEDLAWLREQLVVCEVNSSRVYNWDVVKRREAEARTAAEAAGRK